MSTLEMDRPRPCGGVELIGRYEGSGRQTERYLAKRPDGAYIELTSLLYLVMLSLDGYRTSAEIAVVMSKELGLDVTAENVDYLIEKLLPLGLIETEIEAQPRPEMALGLRVKKAMIPTRVVSAITRVFQHLFHWPVVVLFSAGFVAVLVYTVRGGYLRTSVSALLNKPTQTLVVLGLTLVAMIFHELGHASACRYGGAKPGQIGGGFYLMWPALYTDVSDAYRLKRSGKVRTDLGGVYFNAVLCVVLVGIFIATKYPPLILAVAASVLLMLEQLLPFVRFDGYWIVSDLAGVPDLFPRLSTALHRRPKGKHMKEELRPYSRRIIRIWAWATIVVLPIELAVILLLSATLFVSFSFGVADRFAKVQPDMAINNTPAVILDIIQGLLLVLLLVGLAYALVFLSLKIVRYAVTKWGRGLISRMVIGVLVFGVLAAPVIWSALTLRLVHTNS